MFAFGLHRNGRDQRWGVTSRCLMSVTVEVATWPSERARMQMSLAWGSHGDAAAMLLGSLTLKKQFVDEILKSRHLRTHENTIERSQPIDGLEDEEQVRFPRKRRKWRRDLCPSLRPKELDIRKNHWGPREMVLQALSPLPPQRLAILSTANLIV